MKPISTDLENIFQPVQLREDERKLEPPVQKPPARHQPEPRKKQPNRDYER